MASHWYCQIGTEQFGPMSSADLKQLAREQRLLADHQVRQGEEGRWIAAKQVQGLFSPASPPIKQAAPLAPPISDSSLNVAAVPPAHASATTPAAAKPPPPRGTAPLPSATVLPPAAPPPPRGTPIGVPVGGVPVGAVPKVAVPVGIVPMGVPVAPAPASVPVVKVAPAGPVNIVPVAVAVTPAASRPAPSEGDDATPARGGDKTALYVTVGLAACLVLLLGVGAAFGLGVFNSRPEKKTELATASDSIDSAEQIVDPEPAPLATDDAEASTDVKANQRDAVATKSSPAAPAKGRDANKSQVKAPANEPGKPTAAQEKVLRDVANNKGWRDTSSVKSVTYGSLRMMVAGAWLEGGGDSKATAEAVKGEPAPNPAKPQYVYVEISLGNTKGPGILGYKSWNGAGKKPEETTAILLDSEGRVCPPVARDKAPHAGRRQSVELAMGETTTDVLVFEAPRGEFDYLKLALPYAAIGRTGALGFQIPRDMVAVGKGGGEKPAPLAGSAKPPATKGDANNTELPKDIVGNTRPSETPSVKKPVDPDAPESIKDIVERAAKRDAERKAARKEAERKAAEKPEP